MRNSAKKPMIVVIKTNKEKSFLIIEMIPVKKDATAIRPVRIPEIISRKSDPTKITNCRSQPKATAPTINQTEHLPSIVLGLRYMKEQ
jgi:hypothetical protein